MVDSAIGVQLWIWVLIILKWWGAASLCLLFILVATRRKEADADGTRPPSASAERGLDYNAPPA